MKKMLTNALLSCTALFALSACLSDEEIEARQEWAFDLEGDYSENSGEGTLEISNKPDKNDIAIIFSRDLRSEGEQALLDQVVDEGEREALSQAIALGEENAVLLDELAGGENVSEDFGESSRIIISSAAFDSQPIEAEAENATLRYQLKLTIENGSDVLEGDLTVIQSETRQNDDGDNIVHAERETFQVSFTRDAGPIESARCENNCLPDDGASDGAAE